MTAKQLSHRTGLARDDCSYVLADLLEHGIVSCRNPAARRSRLFWFTSFGLDVRRKLSAREGSVISEFPLPDIDWELYGWVCFSHRAAVLSALNEAQQPSQIKRAARSQNPKLKMSANNVRDVIRLFLAQGLVVRVPGRKKRSHPLYRVTAEGAMIRNLLAQIEQML